MIIKNIILILFILLVCCNINFAYEQYNITDNNKLIEVYKINQSDNINNITINIKPLLWHNYTYNITMVNQTDNSSYNVTNITEEEMYEFTFDNYIRSESFVFINQNNSGYKYNITLLPLNLDVGTYNTFLKIYHNSTLQEEHFYRIIINYDGLFDRNGSFEFGQDTNYHTKEFYDAMLPYDYTNIHNIQTQPYGNMTINCTNFAICSTNFTETSNITSFDVTISVPVGIAPGTYYSYIYLNTNYNKSGNITYKTVIMNTPIQIIQQQVNTDKNLSDLTAEELNDYWENVREQTNEALLKIDAVNRTSEVIVEIEKEVPVPYLANSKDFVMDINDFYNQGVIESVNTLSKKVNQLSSEVKTVTDNNTKLAVENILYKEEIVRQNNSLPRLKSFIKNEYNEEMQDNNYIFKKSFFNILVVFCVISVIVVFVYNQHQKGVWG